MPAWPLPQDYNEAIQSPEISFSDPELRNGHPVTNPLGMPLPRSGNFADVYEFVGASASGAKWAVKCFTREVPGLGERYREITNHLLQLQQPFIVNFTYLQQGMRVRGLWYPILKMEWVDGFLLNQFVRDQLKSSTVMDKLSQLWRRITSRLRQIGIAHADLQHGNILMVPGSKSTAMGLKLIDYDGMWVPALANKKSGEVGHPAYQHPERLQHGVYSRDVDRVPALAIASALRCLSVDGKNLWARYDNGDNLLFRESDLRNPAASPLFIELWQIKDATAHNLVGHLFRGLMGPLGQAPALEEVFDRDGARPLSEEQESRIAGYLGPSPFLRQTPVAIPVATAVTEGRPSLKDSESADAASPWESLDDVLEPGFRRQNKSTKRRVAFLLFFIAILSGLAVSLYLRRSLKGPALHPVAQPSPEDKKMSPPEDKTTMQAKGKESETNVRLSMIVPNTVSVQQGKRASLSLRLIREDFDGMVRLTFGMPPSLPLAPVDVLTGKDQVEIEIDVSPEEAPATHRVRIQGTGNGAKAETEFDLVILPSSGTINTSPKSVSISPSELKKAVPVSNGLAAGDLYDTRFGNWSLRKYSTSIAMVASGAPIMIVNTKSEQAVYLNGNLGFVYAIADGKPKVLRTPKPSPAPSPLAGTRAKECLAQGPASRQLATGVYPWGKSTLVVSEKQLQMKFDQSSDELVLFLDSDGFTYNQTAYVPAITPAVLNQVQGPKYKIAEVMGKAMKGGLCLKVAKGDATAAEKQNLVELFTSLYDSAPPKGSVQSWKTKTMALLDAAKANDSAALKLASNCKACHEEHKKK